MIDDNKKYQSWPDLVTFTKEFKEWIWKLFRKVHARIGHVEEELDKVKTEMGSNYELVQTIEDDEYIYKLVEKNSQTEHGEIVINSSTGIQTVVWQDVYDDEPN